MDHITTANSAIDESEKAKELVAAGPVNNMASKSTFPFLSLPVEVRLKIHRYLLRKDNGSITPSSDHLRYPPIRQDLSGHVNERANSHQILRICKKIREEASTVLYGENVFEWIYSPYVYLHLFRNSAMGLWVYSIGQFNASLVKKMCINMRHYYPPLTEAGKHYWRKALTAMTESIPATVEVLELRVPLIVRAPEGYPSFPEQWWRRRCEALHTAAIVTDHHPTLKRAVWSATNGRQHKESSELTLHEPSIMLGPTGLVKPVALAKRQGVDGKVVIKRDIVLDCAKIRAIGFKDLEKVKDELELALPDDALSSEPSPDA